MNRRLARHGKIQPPGKREHHRGGVFSNDRRLHALHIREQHCALTDLRHADAALNARM